MSKDTDAISEMAEPVLNRLREKLQKDDKWKNKTISGTPWGLVKAAPPTIKGTFGEELIVLFMDKIVGMSAEIIDGGKGQYSVGRKILDEYGFHDIPIIAIAKGKNRNKGDETFFHKNSVIKLNKREPLLSVSYTHLTLPTILLV